ncbi:MAG TPA: hypothetical protein VGV60_15300 [Candidatus Polarisedimenticolia bacterium]|nr:hypothetical protein [Candidatus Polarisedimenticolia bacterium]
MQVEPRNRRGGVILAALPAAGLALLLIAGGTSGPPGKDTDDPGTLRAPQKPRVYLDTALPTLSGRTVSVPAGGDLQKALNEARPGDTLVLEAGGVYRGPFTLPRKPGSDWIVIRSSAVGRDFPPEGARVGPAHAPRMPKLEAASGSVIEAARGAHHYRFIGIEMRPREGTFLYNLVLLGSEESSAAEQPHDIVFDRCYLHGDPRRGTRRGIALNSRATAVIDSHLSDFKEAGADSQAIGGWNGGGPFKIVDNYLEGAGENVMFGGAPTFIDRLVPSDIEIRGNHFFKPLAWKAGDPAYEGTPWSVKNLFELKNARRVLVEGNLFENNWAAAQNGFAILLTVRTVEDSTPWAVVEDVIVTHNMVRRTSSAVNILGLDDGSPTRSGRTRFVSISHNLFLDVGEPGRSGSGIFIQILEGAAGVTVEHNTALHSGSILVADMGPSRGLVFRDNIVEHNEYGVFGSGKGIGLPALEHYFPGYEFRRNVLVGADPRAYPPDNFFPKSLAAIGFQDLQGGTYRLASTSPYRRKASDGSDVGADLAQVSKAGGAR